MNALHSIMLELVTDVTMFDHLYELPTIEGSHTAPYWQ